MTPYRETQDVKQATRLTDDALDCLTGYAKTYDDVLESQKYLDTLSNLIQSEFLIERIVDYFYIDTNERLIWEKGELLPANYIMVGHQNLSFPEIEDAYLFGIIQALTKSKTNIGENVPTTLRKLKTKANDFLIKEDD